MSIEPAAEPRTGREQQENWVEAHREWLESVADGDSAAAWVAEDVLQSLDEEGSS